MLRSLKQLWKRTDGAVAPTVALSMVGLVAAGGIAFDYAHLVTMDTELQQAADQAALAAATQLDRGAGSRARATAAVSDGTAANRLARNLTRFSNDGAGAAVGIQAVIFCSAFDDSVADTDTACEETTDDAEARFVIVRTTLRTANFTLTPIVGAFSGTSRAEAVAGVETSICNVAPLFVCTADANFPSDADIGRGLRLKTGAQNSWAPGNYGFLDFGNGNPGVVEALLGNGLNGCLPTNETNTQPGNKDATDAINTRLDVFAGHTDDPSICNVATGYGCTAPSARKDFVGKLDDFEIRTDTNVPPTQAAAEALALDCPEDPKAAELEYVKPLTPVVGLERDLCHYDLNCGGNDSNFGDGEWDRAKYFNAYHGGDMSSAATFAGKPASELTRYDVYRWEQETAHKATRMAFKRFVHINPVPKITGGGTKFDWTVTTQCTYAEPFWGQPQDPLQKDRRLLPIIAANCEGLNGVGNADEDFQLIRVFDAFITEPSANREYPGVTDEKEIYGEVVGPATPFGGGSGIQHYSRSRPYLIR